MLARTGMSDPSRPELELILCCSRLRVSPAIEQQIRELSSRDIDWTRLVQSALAHGTTPLLCRCLGRMGPTVVPAEILEACEVHTEDNRRRNEHLASELLDVMGSLEDANISAIAFGAPVLASFAYGDLSQRRADSLALFVRGADLLKSCDPLERQGFRMAAEELAGSPFHRAPAAQRWIRDRDGVALRLCGGVGTEALAPSASPGLWERAQRVPLLAGHVRAFAPEDWILVLCATTPEARWSALASICDVAALLEACAAPDLAASVERARSWGCATAVLIGLALAERILAIQLPSEAERSLVADDEALATALRLEKRLRLGRPPTPVSTEAGGPDPSDVRAARPARAAVRASWSARSEAWKRVAQGQGQGESERWLDDELADAARVQPDQTVLDLASGAGDPAISIALRVGPKGLVVATDLLPGMLAGAAQRAGEAGLTGLRFSLADMEALPFGDASFDAVVCRLGLMFSPRIDVSLAEALRVLRPGGRAAHLVWGAIEENTLFRVLHESVAGLFGESPVAIPTPFRLAAPGSLAQALRRAGFADVAERELRSTRVIPPGRRFWVAELERSFGDRISRLPPKLRALLDQRIEEGLAPYRTGEGYRLDSLARVVAGARA